MKSEPRQASTVGGLGAGESCYPTGTSLVRLGAREVMFLAHTAVPLCGWTHEPKSAESSRRHRNSVKPTFSRHSYEDESGLAR